MYNASGTFTCADQLQREGLEEAGSICYYCCEQSLCNWCLDGSGVCNESYVTLATAEPYTDGTPFTDTTEGTPFTDTTEQIPFTDTTEHTPFTDTTEGNWRRRRVLLLV